MILFKPYHALAIARVYSDFHCRPLSFDPDPEGPRKWQTRRFGKCRWKVGSDRGCYTVSPRSGGRPFARVRILSVYREPLGAVDREDARAEGYLNPHAYYVALANIWHMAIDDLSLKDWVWVVTFVPISIDRSELRRILSGLPGVPPHSV